MIAPRRTRPALGLAAVAALLSLTAACGDDKSDETQLPTNVQASSGTESPSPTSTTSSGPELLVVHFAYNTLTVKPGEKITAKDGDQADHTVTSKQSGLFDVTVTKGESSFFNAPSTPGTYGIICRFHPQMAGQLVVKA